MPPTPSVFSKSSVKKFFKGVKRRVTPTRSSPPADGTPQHTSASRLQQKEEVTAAQQVRADAIQAEVNHEEDNKNKVQATQHPTAQPPQPPSNANHPQQVQDALDEIYEEEMVLDSNYAKLFDHENNRSPTYVRFGAFSYYTPNALSLYESLHHSYTILNADFKFLDRNRTFYSPAVSLYYGVIYYIRILACREILNENTTAQSTFFRAFERAFKLESLPIAGFLESQFATIAAYEPKDRRVNYILPQFETMFIDGENYCLNRESRLHQPNIPVLHDWVRAFATPIGNNTRCSNDATFIPHFHENNGSYVPNANDGITLGGFEIVEGTATPNRFSLEVLASLGIDRPVVETANRIATVKRGFERLGFVEGCPRSNSTPAAATENDATAPTFASIAHFLKMNNGNWSWFSICIDQATIHAKHFPKVCYLASLPLVASKEVAITHNIVINGTSSSPVTYPTLRPTVKVATNTIPWFPHLRRSYIGHSSWTEAHVKDHHYYIAQHAATSAQISIGYAYQIGNGQADNYDFTAYPTPVARDTPAPVVPVARHGPFYATQRNGQILTGCEVVLRGESAMNVEYLDRRMNYVRNFYVAKPSE